MVPPDTNQFTGHSALQKQWYVSIKHKHCEWDENDFSNHLACSGLIVCREGIEKGFWIFQKIQGLQKDIPC